VVSSQHVLLKAFLQVFIVLSSADEAVPCCPEVGRFLSPVSYVEVLAGFLPIVDAVAARCLLRGPATSWLQCAPCRFAVTCGVICASTVRA